MLHIKCKFCLPVFVFIIKLPNLLQAARRASVAAESLAAWVRANVQYSYVLEKIEPLEKEQANLQR